jgi:glycosyltransferase involved in cell wall biosynthesis
MAINHPQKQSKKLNLYVSVVVPVYNNGKVLPDTIHRLSAYFAENFTKYELLFVNDCSSDNSLLSLQAAAAKNKKIRLILREVNGGQQQAMADGLLAAKGDVVIGIDADLPCEIGELKKIALLATDQAELVLGKRIGTFHQVFWRRWGSSIGNGLFRLLHPYNIADFGCGIGATRRTVVERLRQKNAPIGIIKLEMLRLAKTYVEVEIHSPENLVIGKSSYSLLKLLRLIWAIIYSSIS